VRKIHMLTAIVVLLSGVVAVDAVAASGYTHALTPAIGLATATNPSNWSTPYGWMRHSGSGEDWFLVPLDIQFAGGIFDNPATYVNGELVTTGNVATLCIQVSGLNASGSTVYGGTTNCQNNEPGVSGTEAYVPSSGQAYLYIGVQGAGTVSWINWFSTAN